MLVYNKNEQNSYTTTTILLTLTHIHKHYDNNKEEKNLSIENNKLTTNHILTRIRTQVMRIMS